MKWLRDWISHRLGWETYEDVLARIAYEIERDYPLERMRADSLRKADEAHARREAERLPVTDGVKQCGASAAVADWLAKAFAGGSG